MATSDSVELAERRFAELRFSEAADLYRGSLNADDASVASLAAARLAETLYVLGRYEDAERMAREFRARATKPEVRAELLNQEAQAMHALGRYAESRPLLTEALRLSSLEIDPARWLDTVCAMASCLRQESEFAEAFELLEGALNGCEQRLADSPFLGIGYYSLGLLQRHVGRLNEARASLRRAGAIYGATLPDDHPWFVSWRQALAGLEIDIDIGAAEALIEEAIASTRRMFGKHPRLPPLLGTLAVIRAHQGRFADAEHLHTAAIADAHSFDGGNGRVSGVALGAFGWFLFRQGRSAEAETLLSEALQINQRLYGERSSQAATSKNNLALIYLESGDFVRAEESFRETTSIVRVTRPEDARELAVSLNNLALALQRQGRDDVAAELFESAIVSLTARFGDRHEVLGMLLLNLGDVRMKQRKYDDARQLYQRSLAAREAIFGDGSTHLVWGLRRLAAAEYELGDRRAAERHLRRAMALCRALNERWDGIAEDLAALLKEDGRHAEGSLLMQAGKDTIPRERKLS